MKSETKEGESPLCVCAHTPKRSVTQEDSFKPPVPDECTYLQKPARDTSPFPLVEDMAPIPPAAIPKKAKIDESHPKAMEGVPGGTGLPFLILRATLTNSPDNKGTNRSWETSREG